MVSGVFSIPLPNKSRSHVRGSAREAGSESRLQAFIGGPENRLAHASVEAVLRSPDHAYNPLVLCGGTGSGKSLLAGGLARRWQDASGSRSGEVKLTDAASFSAEFNRVRTQPRRLAELRERYRSASLVVIDDLHELPTNTTIQRELCGLIDELTAKDAGDQGGQLIVTTRTPCESIKGFLPELVSRLASGLVVPLSPAGEAARRAIVELCCTGADGSGPVELSEEAITYLATGDHPAVADLPLAIARLPRKPGQEPLSASIVRQFIPRPTSTRRIRIDRVARTVAKHFSLTVDDLKSSSRRRNIATARRIVVYFAREYCQKSFGQIGKFLGGRDHTTVLYNHQKALELLQSDTATQKAVAEIARLLKD